MGMCGSALRDRGVGGLAMVVTGLRVRARLYWKISYSGEIDKEMTNAIHADLHLEATAR